MALSIHHSGREQLINLTEILKKRFEINQEAIKEMLKANVSLREGPFQDPLPVRCYPIQLERILDNLLNNATKAIPLKGGSPLRTDLCRRSLGLRRDHQYRPNRRRRPSETPGRGRPGPGYIYHPAYRPFAKRKVGGESGRRFHHHDRVSSFGCGRGDSFSTCLRIRLCRSFPEPSFKLSKMVDNTLYIKIIFKK